MRPDVGTQAQFKKRKPPATYRYDSSLSPALDWDGQNPGREQGEEQLSVISSQLSEIRKLVAPGFSPAEPDAALKGGATRDIEKPSRSIGTLQEHLSKADDARGPAGGFVYKRKQNTKGEEVGGIVPHVTLESIANNETPKEEVLVDRPERDAKITRVTGPFCVEGTIPTPVDVGAGLAPPSVGAIPDSKITDSAVGAVREPPLLDHVDRMLEILRKSPVLRLDGNKTLSLRNIRPPAKTLSLSAEALVDATAPGQSPTLEEAFQEAKEKNGKALPLSAKPVALVFGPENGAVSKRLVQEAAKEASLKNYTHLYVIGFAIQPNARQLIENCDAVVGIPATYIQATPDLMMGDLLKNMRSSQIFSVCGLPEIKIHHRDTEAQRTYQVELLGLDVFDPITMDVQHRGGNDVPAWFLDADYNGLCFHVSQAFFPRTSAWDNLKKALKGEYEESVWDHLAGTTSAPFEAGEHRRIGVKVIDDRGNELMVVEKLV